MRARLLALAAAALLVAPASPAAADAGGSSGPTARLSRTKAQPFEYLTIATSGLDTEVPVEVRFRAGKVEIPVAAAVVAEDYVRVAVPVLLKKAKFAGGAAKVYLAQPEIDEAAECYAGRLRIGRLPRSRLPAGTITNLWADVHRSILVERREALVGTGPPGETAVALQAIDDAVAALDVLLDLTSGAPPAAKEGVRGAVEDFEVHLSDSSLRQIDGLALGMLQASAVNTDAPDLTLTLEDMFEDASEQTSLGVAARLELFTVFKENLKDAVVDDIVRSHGAFTAPLTTAAGLSAMVAGTLALIPPTAPAAPVAAAVAAGLSLAADIITVGQMLSLAYEANWYTDRRYSTTYQVYSESIVRLRDELVLSKLAGGAIKAAGLLRNSHALAEYIDGLREVRNGVNAHDAGLEGRPGVSRLAAGFPSTLPKGIYQFTIGGQTFNLPLPKGFDPNLLYDALTSSVETSCQCIPATGTPHTQVNSTPFDGKGFSITATCTCTFPDGQVATDTQTIRIALVK